MEVSPELVLKGLQVDSLGSILIVEKISIALNGLLVPATEFYAAETVDDLAARIHRR
jgi:hypothetical protein